MSALKVYGDYYKAATVVEKAEDRWLEILGYLAPELDLAIKKLGKHVPCPIHGGTDGFRLKKTSGHNGFSVCNTCGNNPTGIATLMWLKGWTFPDTLEAVARYLGLQPDILEKDRFENRKAQAQGNNIDSSSGVKSSTSPVADKLPPAQQVSDVSYSGPSYADLDDVPYDDSDNEIDSASFAEYESTSNQQSLVVVNAESPSNTNLPAKVESTGRRPVIDITPTPERMAQIKEQQTRMNERFKQSFHRACERVETTWNDSLSIDEGLYAPMRNYLKSRGVLLGRDALTNGGPLRFHPALEYWEEDENGKFRVKGKYPAIVAAVRDNHGKLVTVHRTYLSKTGNKASVPEPRKMQALAVEELSSCAIRMGGMPLDGVLGVAEGLETALSPMKIFRFPTWSLVNTSIMEKFTPPKGVHTVIIWADKDKSTGGQKAAHVLKDRLDAMNINCHIILPLGPIPARKKSLDWNDVLLEQGAMGFPSWQLIRSIIEKGKSLAR